MSLIKEIRLMRKENWQIPLELQQFRSTQGEEIIMNVVKFNNDTDDDMNKGNNDTDDDMHKGNKCNKERKYISLD